MNFTTAIFSATNGRFIRMETIRVPLFSFLVFFLFTSQVCFQEKTTSQFSTVERSVSQSDTLLHQRFAPPPGYERVAADSASCAFYLRHLPLKPPGSKVHLFDGREKANPDIYEAVVDLPIGKKRPAPMRRRRHSAAGRIPVAQRAV